MRSKQLWPVWPQVVVAIGAAAILAACDRPRPTEARGGPSASSARAPGEVANQSYDVVVESVLDTLPSRSHAYHVERRRTTAGWRTRVTKSASQNASAGPGDNQLSFIDIDEDGNQTVSDAKGRRLATGPTPLFKEALDRAPSKYSADLRGLMVKRPTTGAAAAGAKGKQAFDVVDDIVTSKAATRAKLGTMRARHGPPRVDALGREHYSTSEKGATIDVVADPTRAVVTDMTRSENGQEAARLHYEYVDAGDRTVQRQVKYTRSKSDRGPASSLTVTFSHIAVDGKEIKP